MERPSELRAVCQAGKDGDPGWYVVHRRHSIYVTWLLLRAGVPLWSVSLTMMAFGVLGAVLIALAAPAWNVLGFVLLYGAFLLDKVDGEMARYRRIESVHGILLDRFHHRLVEPWLFLAVAIHEVQSGSPSWLLILGGAVVLLANIVDENQHLAPYILLKHLRESGNMSKRSARIQATSRVAKAAALFRPLKMFRMFIVALPAFAACYAVEWATGRAVPAYYLGVSAAGLALYLAFQCIFYLRFQLDAEIASILARFPGLTVSSTLGVSEEAERDGFVRAASEGGTTHSPVPLVHRANQKSAGSGSIRHAHVVERREVT